MLISYKSDVIKIAIIFQKKKEKESRLLPLKQTKQKNKLKKVLDNSREAIRLQEFLWKGKGS